jgi:hypothetical protein
MAGFLNVFQGKIIKGSWWYKKGFVGQVLTIQEFMESRPGKKIPLYAKGEAVYGWVNENGKFQYLKKEDVEEVTEEKKKSKLI